MSATVPKPTSMRWNCIGIWDLGEVIRLLRFSLCQLIAHIQQKFQLFLFRTAVQRNGQPMGFVHVIRWKNSRIFPEGADQPGIAFYIRHGNDFLTGKTQLLLGNVHDNGKPLPIMRN